MKFFIDTANLDEIKSAAAMGVLDGVTTNPSLAAKETMPYRELLAEICKIVSGPVSAEVLATEHDGMLKEAEELAAIADNIVVKIPNITRLPMCYRSYEVGPHLGAFLNPQAYSTLIIVSTG